MADELYFSEQQTAAYKDNLLILDVDPTCICIYLSFSLFCTEDVATLRKAPVCLKDFGRGAHVGGSRMDSEMEIFF